MSDFTPPLVYLIGDSIRGSYQSILVALFGKRAKVDGPRDNSFDSANIRRRLCEWLPDQAPAALTLNCGLHDVRRSRPEGGCQVALDDYRENIDWIMNRVTKYCGYRPYWLTTTPVDEAMHNANREYDRYNRDIDEYNGAARELACQYGWPVIDLHEVIARGPAREYLSEDGVHLNDAGRLAAAGALISPLRRRVTDWLKLDQAKTEQESIRDSMPFRIE